MKRILYIKTIEALNPEKNQDLLRRILAEEIDGQDWGIRLSAVKKLVTIDNIELLESRAANDESSGVRKAAAEKLKEALIKALGKTKS